MDINITVTEISAESTISETVITCDVVITNAPNQLQSDWNQTDNLAVDYIKNKPTIPDEGVQSVTSTDNHIVVDNTDPKNPSLIFQTVDNENFLTDDELANLNNQSGTNTGDQDLSDLQPKIGVTLETTATTIEAAINEVRTIALGSDIAYVFDTETDMNAWLLIPANVAKLQIGNLFLIRETTVPDYWWDGVSALELEVKIDLTNYYTKLEIDQLLLGKSNTGHTHTGETILPDAIKITKVYSDAEIAALAANTLFWDDVNQTYAFKLADGGVIQINQEPFDLYTNLEGSAINEMYVVSFCGASGNRTAVCLTDATDDTKSRNCFGMVTVSSIGINQVGRITKTGGKVRGLNTDVVGWAEGDTLYVHPTIKGTLTNVAPPAGTNKVRVGTLTVKHQNQGVIELNIHVESKLANLVDVDGTDTAILDTDEILKKDTAGLWKKISAINIKTWLGLTFAKIVDYFSKTESDRRFVNQNGGTIYHITRWFTPTSALTIAANGLSATITSGQFTAAMTGAKLRLTGGVNEPIITFVNSNNITLSFAVDASFFGQSVAIANWGIYERRVELNALKTDKIIPNSDTTGVVIRNAADTADVAFFDTANKIFKINDGQFLIGTNIPSRHNPSTGYKWQWFDGASSFATESAGGFESVLMMNNIVRYNSAWDRQNTSNPGYMLAITSGASNRGFYLQKLTAANTFTQLFRFDINDNFIVGTGTPETKLDVNGTTTLRDWVYLNNGTHTGDAVGDRRYKVVSDVYTLQRCAVNSATKGDATVGNWLTIYTNDANGFWTDQYDDVLPSTEWTPASGGAAPDIATHTIGTIAANYRAFDGGTTEESMTSSFEILHGIDVDALNRVTTPLLAEVHTHGMAATNGSGVVKIFYDIVYQGVNMAPEFLGTFTNLITVNANEQYWHKLGGVEFTKPTGGFAIGGQLIVKYRRNPQDAQDTYTGDWLFMQCALHMPFNSNGSRQRYVK